MYYPSLEIRLGDFLHIAFVNIQNRRKIKMKIIYKSTRIIETEVQNFYKEVSLMLSKEDVSNGSKEVEVEVPTEGRVIYKISLRSGTPFIVQVYNDLPDSLLLFDARPVYLTCVIPEKNSYKFYKLTPNGNNVLAEYGRMGTNKGELFGARSFYYPLEMFWIKYAEKLAKGYVDRSDVYLEDDIEDDMEEQNDVKQLKGKGIISRVSSELFNKLKQFSSHAVREAKVQIPITKAILRESKKILQKMYGATSLEEFNGNVLEIVSLLQRPVHTGDGTGVKRLLANSPADYTRIIQRESDLIQAMEGSYYGTGIRRTETNFYQYGVEVYLATDKQREQVMNLLSNQLKDKVKNIYRVIPQEQQKKFNDYLKEHNIKKVMQLWHGSRNQNWMSIILNSLQLNPDAIITGKMFGNGIYFAPSSMKSWNYTSYRGTSWARGNSDTAFMGLYAVAYGTPLDTDSWSGSIDYKQKTVGGGYDCLHAHKGSALMNDEIIFYDEAAMVLNYIVEFE